MKKLLLVGIIILCAACSSKPDHKETPEEKAQIAAELYYKALYLENYKAFLDGRENADNMPESFRNVLITNFKQHVALTKQLHRGVYDIKALRAKKDTTLGLMQVFLQLQYSDSVKEEIVVPMVEKNGEWKLK